MKIIEKGVDPKTIPLVGKCYTCNTTVEFLQSEGTYHSSIDQRDCESWSVPCPVCNGVIHGYKKSK